MTLAIAAGLVALAAALPLSIGPPEPLGPPAADGAPFDTIGRALVEARGLDPETADVHAMLVAASVPFELGAFELILPRDALADAAAAERLRRAAHAVLVVHGAWLDVVDPKGERVDRDALDADVKALDAWIRGWKAKDLAAIPPGADFAASLPAKDKERAALARFNSEARAAGLPVTGDAAPPRARIVLAPDRRTFVALAAACGLLREDQRSVYWQDGVPGWVEFRFDATRVVALEFASDAGWDQGTPMDARNPSGLEQQVAQLAVGSLLLARFDNRIDADFSLALCNNVVIDAYKEVDTRTDGDLRPRSAPARKVFVPGGLSQGGVLPPNNADGRWRETKGSDRFLGVLREAQKAGASELGDRKAVGGFLIRTEDESATFLARPPFFGEAAARTVVPGEEFRSEWIELQRAYRVAFCHWLRKDGAKGEAASRAAFASLLAALAPERETDFAAAVEAAYGMPVSSAELTADDLEGRFLRWLAKQR